MQSTRTIKCPNCTTEIDVNEVLTHEIKEELRQKEEDLKNQYSKKEKALQLFKEELYKQKNQQEELLEKRMVKERKKLRQALQEELKKELTEEQTDLLKEKDKELEEKSRQLKAFNQTKAAYSRLKREKDELKNSLEAKYEEQLNNTLLQQQQKIKETMKAKQELTIRELKKKLHDQKQLTEEMKRKQEQGSMQLQGEVQELAIEEFLRSQFPLDEIEEVKKGYAGADCLQTVNTYSRRNCGSIYYESKRTKNFNEEWVGKFKSDIREKRADIGILVTQVLPKALDRMGYYKGIYVCTFSEFQGLAQILRQSVIRWSEGVQNQKNKGDKMNMLYDFLTSHEFRLHIEAIVEGFSKLKADLAKEKRAMQGIWKKREKQLEKVTINVAEMYGGISGIAGQAVPSIEALQLGEEIPIEENPPYGRQ